MNYEDRKNEVDQSESEIIKDEEEPCKRRTRSRKMRLVKPLKFTCDLCSRSYKYQKNLDRHKCLKPEFVYDGSKKTQLPDEKSASNADTSETVVSFM